TAHEFLFLDRDAVELGHGVHVLVATAGQVDDHDVLARQAGRRLHGPGHGVAGLKRGDDALAAGQVPEGGERLLIRDGRVVDAPRVLQPGVLGADARVVKARGDRVRLDDLAV